MSVNEPTRCTNLPQYHKEKVKLVKIRLDLQRRAAIQQRLKESAWKTQRALERKESENAERILRGLERDEKINDRKQRVFEAEQNRKRQLLSSVVTKEVNTFIRQKALKEFEAAKAKHEKATEWISRKYEASKKQVEKEAFVKAVAKADLKQRAARRQEKVERQREEFPIKLAAKKQKAESQHKLVKKFATIWLNKTRAKVQAREDHSDDFHNSMFIGREGQVDPMNQAEADMMEMEPAMKAVLTVMHKEKTQALADYFVSSVRNRKSNELKHSNSASSKSHAALINFSQHRQSSITTIKQFEKPTGESSHTLLN